MHTVTCLGERNDTRPRGAWHRISGYSTLVLVSCFRSFLGSNVLSKLALVCWLCAGCAGPAFSAGAGTGGGAPSASGGSESAPLGGNNGGDASQGGTGGLDASGGTNVLASGGSVGGSSPSGGAAPTGSGGALFPSGGAPAILSIPRDGLVLWLAADRGVTNTSGAVARWQDQSSNKADATQVVVAARPRVASAGNSLSMIEFDGEDDFLALPDGFDDFSNGLSFFAVVEALGDDECSSIVQLSAGAETEDLDFGRQQRSVHYEDGDVYLTGTPDALPKGERKLVEVVHSPSTDVDLRVDGQYVMSGKLPLPATLTRTANLVGGTLYTNCAPLEARVGEIVLYSRALSLVERTRVQSYLREKWSCCTN